MYGLEIVKLFNLGGGVIMEKNLGNYIYKYSLDI